VQPYQPFNPRDPDSVLIPTFRNHAVPNEAKSITAGRPIYDDVEVVDIRRAGSRDFSTHPSTEFARWVIDPRTGGQIKETYAERFRHQYQQYKAQAQQTLTGTPLDVAPFLSEARRAEMRALNVLTVEQLAHVDGQELKNLGPGGRDLKNQAMEYIEQSKTNAPTMQLAAELEAERARRQTLEEDVEALKRRLDGEGQFKDMTDDQIREFITSNAGHAPQGNLPRKTLVRMAMDHARPTKAA
jgi:hypothetical protein